MSTHDNYHSATCTWIGDSPETHTSSCTLPSIEGKSYCCNHVWRVYQEGSAVKPRKRRERTQSSLQDLIDDFIAAADELAAEDAI
jgi:hypothetical protein